MWPWTQTGGRSTPQQPAVRPEALVVEVGGVADAGRRNVADDDDGLAAPGRAALAQGTRRRSRTPAARRATACAGCRARARPASRGRRSGCRRGDRPDRPPARPAHAAAVPPTPRLGRGCRGRRRAARGTRRRGTSATRDRDRRSRGCRRASRATRGWRRCSRDGSSVSDAARKRIGRPSRAAKGRGSGHGTMRRRIISPRPVDGGRLRSRAGSPAGRTEVLLNARAGPDGPRPGRPATPAARIRDSPGRRRSVTLASIASWPPYSAEATRLWPSSTQ